MIRIETERLIIRDHISKDLKTYHDLISDNDVMIYLQDIRSHSLEQSKASLENAIKESQLGEERIKYFFGIYLKSGDYIGEIGYTVISKDSSNQKCVGLGYFIHKVFWKKGITTEAVKAIIDFAFHQNNVIKIETGCLVDNQGSEKIMVKVGFIKEAYKINHQFLEGKWMDRVEYGMMREE